MVVPINNDNKAVGAPHENVLGRELLQHVSAPSRLKGAPTINDKTLLVRANGGFTLIELLIVIVLISTLAAVSSTFIANPMKGFVDSNRRAELVDVAETALQRMVRETRHALPNSVRLANDGVDRFAIEFLRTTTGGRYRALQTLAGTGFILNFTVDAGTFDVLGGLPDSGLIDTSGGSGRSSCFDNTIDCLVVYNTGTTATDFNAYNGDNIAGITAASNLLVTFDNTDVAGFSFPAASPGQRFSVVDTPVSFVCDNGSNQLLMYLNYNIQATQPVTVGNFGGGGFILADNVTNCNASTFVYNSGVGTRHGLVVIRLSISPPGSTDTISLLQQVHVLNAP